MKYIVEGRLGFDHRPYWKYLETVKGIMPESLFVFAHNDENHNLTSPNSLHDSWLQYWRIEEVAENENRRGRSIRIEGCFLGPMHDRYIYLRYKNVEKHSILADYQAAKLHGDLLVHELVVERQGLYSHELVFAQGAVFAVHFTEMEHRVELIANQA